MFVVDFMSPSKYFQMLTDPLGQEVVFETFLVQYRTQITSSIGFFSSWVQVLKVPSSIQQGFFYWQLYLVNK